MANSIIAPAARKPQDVSDTLTPRGDGRWCKKYKVDGKSRYWYGRGTEAEATAEWQRVKADLLAGHKAAIHPKGRPRKPTAASPDRKPRKPAATTNQLTPRGDGRWCKKITVNGIKKIIYFTGTEKEAQAEWDRTKSDHLAGRRPRPKGEGLSVLELCDRFLVAKKIQCEAGELRQLTWADYKRTAERVCSVFGRSRLVDDLTPEDFEKLKVVIAKTMGPVAIGNAINRTRVIFKYGYDSGLLLTPMRFGPLFKRPSRKLLRMERAKNPPKIFTADEIKKLLDAATPQLKAMMLLGVNAAFGNNDCATLEFDHLDLDGGWVNMPRPKTGIDRRCKLWPETIDALKDSIKKRRTPKNRAHSNLVFITAAKGSFGKDTTDSPVTKEFAKLVRKTKLRKRGRNFYALRHTFRTAAGGAKDVEAIRAIMGHVNEHVEAAYIHFDDDERLEAVADHVRRWLFPDEGQELQTSRPVTKSKQKPRPLTNDSSGLRVVG